jgi:hypothetical protein
LSRMPTTQRRMATLNSSFCSNNNWHHSNNNWCYCFRRKSAWMQLQVRFVQAPTHTLPHPCSVLSAATYTHAPLPLVPHCCPHTPTSPSSTTVAHMHPQMPPSPPQPTCTHLPSLHHCYPRALTCL